MSTKSAAPKVGLKVLGQPVTTIGKHAASINTDELLNTLITCLESNDFQPLEAIRGSYIACLIDQANGRSILKRGREGCLTAFWHYRDGRLTAATSASDLVNEVKGHFQENPEFLSNFFAFQPAEPPGQTALLGINELLPGETLVLGPSGLHIYREPFRFELESVPDSDSAWIETFRDTLKQSIEGCTRGQEKVASMLSGGLDSGPMTAIAFRQLLDRGGELLPISWTLTRFPDADERSWIELLCRQLGIQPRLFDGSDLVPFSRLEIDQINPDFPAFNAFRLLKLECYRLAAEAGCRVILNGHAGDQIYLPRSRFLIDLWRRRDFSGIKQLLRGHANHGGLKALLNDPAARHFLSKLWPLQRHQALPNWLTRTSRKYLEQDRSFWPPEAASHRHPDFARQLLGARMAAGMSHEQGFAERYGVESRDPFQNEDLLRLMLNAPGTLSFRQGKSKWVMREAMKGILPESFRLKQRTGILKSFFNFGLNQNRKTVHNLLFERNRAWQHYVRSDYVENALARSDRTSKENALINQCVGYALWREYWEKR